MDKIKCILLFTFLVVSLAIAEQVPVDAYDYNIPDWSNDNFDYEDDPLEEKMIDTKFDDKNPLSETLLDETDKLVDEMKDLKEETDIKYDNNAEFPDYQVDDNRVYKSNENLEETIDNTDTKEKISDQDSEDNHFEETRQLLETNDNDFNDFSPGDTKIGIKQDDLNDISLENTKNLNENELNNVLLEDKKDIKKDQLNNEEPPPKDENQNNNDNQGFDYDYDSFENNKDGLHAEDDLNKEILTNINIDGLKLNYKNKKSQDSSNLNDFDNDNVLSSKEDTITNDFNNQDENESYKKNENSNDDVEIPRNSNEKNNAKLVVNNQTDNLRDNVIHDDSENNVNDNKNDENVKSLNEEIVISQENTEDKNKLSDEDVFDYYDLSSEELNGNELDKSELKDLDLNEDLENDLDKKTLKNSNLNEDLGNDLDKGALKGSDLNDDLVNDLDKDAFKNSDLNDLSDDLKELEKTMNKLSEDTAFNTSFNEDPKAIKEYEEKNERPFREEYILSIRDDYEDNLDTLQKTKEETKTQSDVIENQKDKINLEINNKTKENLTSSEELKLISNFAEKYGNEVINDAKQTVNSPTHLTLKSDEPVVISSPGFPGPYPVNSIFEWILEGDGVGIELNVTDMDINGHIGDYLLIKPGSKDDSGEEGLVFTYMLKSARRYRFLDSNVMYIRFKSNPGFQLLTLKGFSLSARLLREHATEETEEPEPEESAQRAEHSLLVYLAGVTPQQFDNSSEEFRLIVADMATFYINVNGLDYGEYNTTEATKIISTSSCNVNLPGFERCVAVRFSVQVSDDPENPGLTEDQLNDMWKSLVNVDPFGSRLKRLGIVEFTLPNESRTLMVWSLIGVGVIVSALVLALGLWRWNCLEEYKRMPAFSDTDSIISGKRKSLGLYPTPHQNLPPLFDDDLARYDDSSRVDIGGYANKSYTREGDLFDLESDDDIVGELSSKRSRFTTDV